MNTRGDKIDTQTYFQTHFCINKHRLLSQNPLCVPMCVVCACVCVSPQNTFISVSLLFFKKKKNNNTHIPAFFWCFKCIPGVSSEQQLTISRVDLPTDLAWGRWPDLHGASLFTYRAVRLSAAWARGLWCDGASGGPHPPSTAASSR